VYVFLWQMPRDVRVQPEIQGIEAVRGQLHQLLAMSEHSIPGSISDVTVFSYFLSFRIQT